MISRHDLRQSLSRLSADYTFSVTVIFTMALGLAISLFLFAQVYSMAYKPLPFKGGDRIVSVSREESNFQPTLGGIGQYDAAQLVQLQTSLDQFSVFELGNFDIATDSYTERFPGARVGGPFFSLTGVDAHLGRTLTPHDSEPGNNQVAVISFELWKQLFAQAPSVLGSVVRIGGSLRKIVGVMPEGYRFPVSQDIWIPYQHMQIKVPNGEGWVSGIGKLKQGVNVEQAEDNFVSLAKEIEARYPIEYKGKSLNVNYLTQAFAEQSELVIVAMRIVAIAILLMACASVSNLLLVRMLEQKKESMIKLALGLPFWRVAQALILESFWLCLFSGLLGFGLCALAIDYTAQYAFSALGPFWWSIEMSPPIWMAGLSFILLIWCVTSALPLITSLKTPTNSVLSGGRKGSGGEKSGPFMNLLIACQVICAFLLMSITSLSAYNFFVTINADYGVDPQAYLSASVQPPPSLYPTFEARNNYYEQLRAELLNIQNVEAVTFMGVLPGSFSNSGVTYSQAERDQSSAGEFPRASEISLDADALDTFDIELIAGRGFTEADTRNSEAVMMVNESFARKHWPNESALGKGLQINPDRHGPLVTIVGVVKDIVYGYPSRRNLESDVIYRPMQQVLHFWAGAQVAVRYRGKLLDAVTPIKQAARKVDAQVPLSDLIPYEDRLHRNAQGVQTLIYNFLPAALLALVMAGVGIYGIAARQILQKTSDIGIMKALGAQDSHINRRFLQKSVLQLFAGLIPGIVIFFFLLPALLQQLEIENFMLTTVISIVSLLIAATVMMASYLPLRRVHAMSPQTALLNDER